MSDISYTPLTTIQYNNLIQKAVKDKIPAVVLGKTTYVISDIGAVSVLGQQGITTEQITLFKTWLINKYK